MSSSDRGAAAGGLRLALGLVLVLSMGACGGGGGGGNGSTVGGTAAPNVLQLSVNGERCGGTGAYPNQPCVRVTVCQPGTSTCRTVDDVLLDTCSFGLRVFRQALAGLQLRQVPAASSGGLATCVHFADLSSDWGPVQVADVVLGGEPAVEIPIHVLDAAYGPAPSSCPDPETGPDVAGFNGILGVGPLREDCGDFCASEDTNDVYFACDATGCVSTRAAVGDQVQNPVAHLPTDNNGVIVDLPKVGPGGAGAVEGQLVLGLGTSTNNAVDGLSTLPLDPHLSFTTTLQGVVMSGSFLDTGSNGLFFASPTPALVACAAPAAAWYCTGAMQSFTASNAPSAGGAGIPAPFQIDDFHRLASSGQRVFPDLGGPGLAGAGFDWGLPFFLGRRVAVGIEGQTSPLGPGPVVAY